MSLVVNAEHAKSFC